MVYTSGAGRGGSRREWHKPYVVCRRVENLQCAVVQASQAEQGSTHSEEARGRTGAIATDASAGGQVKSSQVAQISDYAQISVIEGKG